MEPRRQESATLPLSGWCSGCLADMLADPASCCSFCSAELKGVRPGDGDCRLCAGLDLRFDRAIAIGNYHRTLRDMVVRLKGQRDEALACRLGMVLGARIRQLWESAPFDIIVPVPAWWMRRLRRGFQASAVIADGVSRVLNAPVDSSVLYCQRRSAKQGLLTTPQRFQNVDGMFGIRSGAIVAGLRVLLVDDVMTSGATASAAARTLKRAGRAAAVEVAVLARGARGN